MSLLSLPTELHLEIISYLNVDSIRRLLSTSSYFHELLAPDLPALIARNEDNELPRAISHYLKHNLTSHIAALLPYITEENRCAIACINPADSTSGYINPLAHRHGYTSAIDAACYYGNVATIQLMLPYFPWWSVDPGFWHSGDTDPLITAVRRGKAEVVKLLLRFLALQESCNDSFTCPMASASKEGEWIFEKSPVWDDIVPNSYFCGWAVDKAAEWYGDENKILEVFVEEGLNENALKHALDCNSIYRVDTSPEAVKLLVGLDVKFDDTWVALASSFGNWDIVQALITEGGCKYDVEGGLWSGDLCLIGLVGLSSEVRVTPLLVVALKVGPEALMEEMDKPRTRSARWLEEGKDLIRLLLEMGASVENAEDCLKNMPEWPEKSVAIPRLLDSFREVIAEAQACDPSQ